MLELIISLVLNVSAVANVPIDFDVRSTENERVYAQHAVGKSGQHYLLFNLNHMGEVSDYKKKAIVAHEISHAMVYYETGKTSMKHGFEFKKACKKIAEDSNVPFNKACKRSH